ncbi:MAG: HEAT repeat domain-containing protein [Chloroflexia bacterium]
MSKAPRWKTMKFSAQSIFELQESEDEKDWGGVERLVKRAKTAEIIAVLAETDHPDVRAVLCYGLGRRCAIEAVPVLIDCLHDPDGRVCTEAAEALGNIGDPRAGPVLFEQFCGPTKCSENLLAYALGAVGYRPAIPKLIEALADPDLRGSATISLGSLGVVEAKAALQDALNNETDSESVRKLIKRALSAIEVVTNTLDAKSIQSVLPSIIEALEASDPLPNRAAVRALTIMGNIEAEDILRDKLSRSMDECGLTQRIQEALKDIEPRNSQGAYPADEAAADL